MRSLQHTSAPRCCPFAQLRGGAAPRALARRQPVRCAVTPTRPQQQQSGAAASSQDVVPLSQQQLDAILPQPDDAAAAQAGPRSAPARPQPQPTQQSVVTASYDQMLSNWAEQYQMPAEMSLWDEDGRRFSSARDIQLAYLPPKSDLPGLAVALSIIGCWAAMFQHAVWCYDLSAPLTLPHVLDGLFTFASLEYLSSGLFIVTHDSMHGAITPNNRFLNDVVGAICVSLYAWFDYDLMWQKHWAHHNECGTPKDDPDFHAGDPAFWPWFFSFMRGYISPLQFGKLFAITTSLAVFGHAPILNQLVFWAGAGGLSALRLFYFGTYLPHKPRKGAQEVMSWAKARSAREPAWVSMLQCWCFAMHWEHHRWPFAPFWDLPRARAVRYAAIGSLDGMDE